MNGNDSPFDVRQRLVTLRRVVASKFGRSRLVTIGAKQKRSGDEKARVRVRYTKTKRPAKPDSYFDYLLGTFLRGAIRSTSGSRTKALDRRKQAAEGAKSLLLVRM